MSDPDRTIDFWRTTIGDDEQRFVAESISQENISMGPVCARLESAVSGLLGVQYVTAVPSGSMGLILALMALGVKPGDEVIVPDISFISTAHAPRIIGAKVTLVDVMKNCPLMDVTDLKRKLSPKTKAIIIVNLNGRNDGVRQVIDFAKANNVPVIEDACQALGSRNGDIFLGTQGAIGVYSLGMVKLVTSGAGGLVVTKDHEIHQKMRLMRTHGIDGSHENYYSMLGFNFKFPDVLAAIGLIQLSRIEQKIRHVVSIYKKYAKSIERMSFIEMIPVAINKGEVPLYAEVVCAERKRLVEYLRSKKIATKTFHPCLHEAKYLESGGRYKNAEIFSQRGLLLPSGPAQSLGNIEYVLAALEEFSG